MCVDPLFLIPDRCVNNSDSYSIVVTSIINKVTHENTEMSVFNFLYKHCIMPVLATSINSLNMKNTTNFSRKTFLLLSSCLVDILKLLFAEYRLVDLFSSECSLRKCYCRSIQRVNLFVIVLKQEVQNHPS